MIHNRFPFLTRAARRPGPGRRRGVSVLEVLVASGVLGIAMGMLAVLTSRLTAGRHSIDEQQRAVIELDNVLEDLVQRPFADVTPEAAAAVQLSPQAAERLPEGDLKVVVADIPAGEKAPAARKITATLHWRPGPGLEKSASLSAWVHEVPR